MDIAALINAQWSSDSSKRDDLLGLNLGLGDDLFSSNYDSSNLLKQKLQQDDAHQRAAFPIMDAFKEHTLLSADDLREKVENSYSDKAGIREAVEQALNKLHKRKEQEHKQADQAHAPNAPSKPHVVTAKELIDEVVKQEIASHIDNNAASPGNPTSVVDSDDLKSKLHEKLEEITKIETKLFSLIRDVKGFLLTKKAEQGTDSSSNDESNIDNLSLDSLVSKRSEIPLNINKFRDNVTLVENFIRDALKDDFTIDPDEFSGSDTEDKKTAKQGDTRDLLGKEETEKALLKEAIPGEIEDIPMSSLEREIDENDSVASDRGITRDALVDSPFSDLDYKKATGKRSRHFVS
ncbi:hypothetical protein ACROYT_G009715 [Oculina patagonica]